MLLPSAEEMRSFDERTISSGVTEAELIERAGCAVWGVIRDYAGQSRKYLILCGPGNNGEDGKVIGRLAKDGGVDVEVVLVRANFDDALLKGLEKSITEADIIVDAILGNGQKEAPRGSLAKVVELINEEHRSRELKVISVDVPTGINTSSGEVLDPCIEADLTVSIQCTKRGLTQFPARERCGEIITVDIGILTPFRSEFSEFSSSEFEFQPRDLMAHKSSFGRVLVISGSKNMPGASVLVSHGAQRVGAGLVTKISMESWHDESLRPEVIRFYVNGCEGSLCKEDFSSLIPVMEKSDVVVLGPGIGTSQATREFFFSTLGYLEKEEKKILLDADALNILSPLKRRIVGAIITPHPGEACRLLNCSIDEIERDRFGATKELCKLSASTVVLKGASTIVGYGGFEGGPGFSGLVHYAPNPYIASGGAGDALCGVIAGLWGASQEAFDAANWGNYFHSRAGRIAHDESGGPVSATDLIERLPFALGEILNTRK